MCQLSQMSHDRPTSLLLQLQFFVWGCGGVWLISLTCRFCLPIYLFILFLPEKSLNIMTKLLIWQQCADRCSPHLLSPQSKRGQWVIFRPFQRQIRSGCFFLTFNHHLIVFPNLRKSGPIYLSGQFIGAGIFVLQWLKVQTKYTDDLL